MREKERIERDPTRREENREEKKITDFFLFFQEYNEYFKSQS